MVTEVNPSAASEDFEKWMRMASDNKINSTNSWDLALIDYFYDLSVLREKDGINFQKASTTLDGCVKIYSSRVDSVAAETGKLLNGLATSKRASENSGEGDDEDEEEGDEDDVDVNAQLRRRRNKANSNKNTIVDFEVIKVKKMDVELHVDPLFKKVLTDFDEGGSKSSLLNMLSVDENQKIIFDTTESGSAKPKPKRRNSIIEEEDEDEVEDENMDNMEHSFAGMDIENTMDPGLIDVNSIGEKYFSGSEFSSLQVCPSVKDLYSVLNHEITPTSVLQGLESTGLNNYYNSSQQQSANGGDDYGFDVSFGGGDYDDYQVDAQNNSKYPGNKSSIFFNDLEDVSDEYGNTMRELFREGKSFSVLHEAIDEEGDEEEQFAGDVTNIPDNNLLAYFDQNLRNNWAGPDHWKVRQLKAIMNFKPTAVNEELNEEGGDHQPALGKTRKKAAPLVIDFLSSEYPDEDKIFESSSTKSILKESYNTQNKHILPIDLNYTTRNFINLFQKDQLINSMFKKAKHLDNVIDESVYAGLNDDQQQEVNVNNPDFFHDDQDNGVSYGGVDYDDYGDDLPVTTQEQFTQTSQISGKFSQTGALNYSRVSKKVDIKLLKDNIWETLNAEVSTRKSMIHTTQSSTSPTSSTVTEGTTADETLKFSQVVNEVCNKYDANSKKDLSTSYCFICLLHLANENGFTIENDLNNSDLIINNFQVPV